MFDYETFRLKMMLNRKNFKLTQEELGNITGLDEKNISKLEIGDHLPRLKTAILILNAFNSSVSSFMGNVEDEKLIMIEYINKFLLQMTPKERKLIFEFIQELNREIE